MPKPKMYFQFELPSSVVEIVKTVCADYTRRERAIKYGNVTGAVSRSVSEWICCETFRTGAATTFRPPPTAYQRIHTTSEKRNLSTTSQKTSHSYSLYIDSVYNTLCI